MAVMGDACVKPIRYANVGLARQSDTAKSTAFLGAGASKVMEDYASGDLTSEAQLQYAAGHCSAAGADDDGNDDGPLSCTSNLSCSRASASARGVVHIAGIAGVVCAHSMPGRGLFLAMPTPEQHTYHIRNFTEAALRRSDIKDMYIDYACRIEGSLRASMRATEDLSQDMVEKASGHACVWVRCVHLQPTISVPMLGTPACTPLLHPCVGPAPHLRNPALP